MVTCSGAGHTQIQHSKSQLTLSRITYPLGSCGLISITFVAKTSFTKPDMNRHCYAINETSNKKKHGWVGGGGLLNLETIRRAVHRTTVFGERQSHSPLHNDLLYHFYIRYIEAADCSHIPSLQPRKMKWTWRIENLFPVSMWRHYTVSVRGTACPLYPNDGALILLLHFTFSQPLQPQA